MKFPTKALLRNSGLLFSGLFFIIFYLLPYIFQDEQNNSILLICSIIASISIISPYRLRTPYALWIKLGDILSKINSRIILSIFFYCLITPFAILKKPFNFLLNLNHKHKSNYLYLDDSEINLKDEY